MFILHTMIDRLSPGGGKPDLYQACDGYVQTMSQLHLLDHAVPWRRYHDEAHTLEELQGDLRAYIGQVPSVDLTPELLNDVMKMMIDSKGQDVAENFAYKAAKDYIETRKVPLIKQHRKQLRVLGGKMVDIVLHEDGTVYDTHAGERQKYYAGDVLSLTIDSQSDGYEPIYRDIGYSICGSLRLTRFKRQQVFVSVVNDNSAPRITMTPAKK